GPGVLDAGRCTVANKAACRDGCAGGARCAWSDVRFGSCPSRGAAKSDGAGATERFVFFFCFFCGVFCLLAHWTKGGTEETTAPEKSEKDALPDAVKAFSLTAIYIFIFVYVCVGSWQEPLIHRVQYSALALGRK
ncbi:hypothetical protein TcG_08750, partial [Trypanosoma cruzi]